MSTPDIPATILELRGGETSSYLARLVTKPILVFLIVFAATVVQVFRHGISIRYLILLSGSLAAGILLLAFGLLVITGRGRKRRSILAMLIAFGGFVPYIFGCYLCFYEGLWRLKGLFDSFSVSLLVVSLLFVIAGYIIVKGTYLVSEFARKIDEEQIVIKDS